MPDNPTEWLAPQAGNPIWCSLFFFFFFPSWRVKPRSGATERLYLQKYWYPIPSWYYYKVHSRWHSCPDKDQSGIQSPYSLPLVVAGPRWERLSGTIVTGFVLRMFVTLSTTWATHKPAVKELQMMRRRFLDEDLSLISQEKKKKNPRQRRKRPGVPRMVSQETTLDNNTTMMDACHSLRICPNPRE